ncbi:hypothetical protein GCM10011579_056690 [Streptomyces albiflavescens]|uniref:Polysaccharide lyase 8 N-terminal alpha-helical domain-containing protein n=1 Tax=Streptomyces albiflavescens TaxID=1623582 RepID=A0A918D7N2_9ACTN|nr:hypothetical protein GCM10011579_056690 [Streptomyces albiflavescens]
MTPTRRMFLLAAALTAAASAPSPAAADEDDEYATLRRRWLDIALGTGYEPTAEPYASRLRETGELARGFGATMTPTAGSLWPGYPFDPPSGITQSYSRLWTMTQAYVQEGTGSTGDETLLAQVISGLDHLSATVYNPSTTRYGNWWEWQIGSPRLLMDIVAALHDELTRPRREAACAAVDNRRSPPLRGHGPRRAPRPGFRRGHLHGLRADRALRVRQRGEPARLAHGCGDDAVVGRRTLGAGRSVHRLVLAHRGLVPAARNDRVHQATCRQGGR